MPQSREPDTLLSLCHKQLCTNILNDCNTLNVIATTRSNSIALAVARHVYRPTYVTSLPGQIRCRLMEETSQLVTTMQRGGSNGPTPLFIAALLLGNDVRRLKVELCCYYGCSHQAALFKLLASDGRGLERLELARSSLLRLDRNLLQGALLNTPTLTTLILRNIASDPILQVIGSTCPKLVYLDVSHSRQVCDLGISNLLLSVQLRDKDSSWSNDNEEMHIEQPTSTQFISIGLKPRENGWKKLRSIIRGFFGAKRKPSDHSFCLEYFEQRHLLCNTLRVLKVANTNVSVNGVMLALQHIPGLQSLGDYLYMGRVFEQLNRTQATRVDKECLEAPTSQLIYAHMQHPTERRLDLLALGCPQLEKLSVTEPHHPPLALRYFPKTLTTLHLHSIPANAEWTAEFYDYLALPQARCLKDLTLNFVTTDVPPALDLSKIVPSCPNLCILSVDGSEIDWTLDQHNYIQPMTKLYKIHLGRNVKARVLTELLICSPKLQILHCYLCSDLTDQHLASLTSKSNSSQSHNRERCYGRNDPSMLFQQLSCFYIYDAPHITATTISAFIANCPNLDQIGNLTNLGFDHEQSNILNGVIQDSNLRLSVMPGSHWFSSPCFS